MDCLYSWISYQLVWPWKNYCHIYTPQPVMFLSSDLHAGALNVKDVAGKCSLRLARILLGETSVHLCAHFHSCIHWTHANATSHGEAELQRTHRSAHRHTQELTPCGSAIGKVRPTLTVLCCCQPSRHVFKQVFFFPCSLTYAGKQPHRHSSICWQASVSAL